GNAGFRSREMGVLLFDVVHHLVRQFNLRLSRAQHEYGEDDGHDDVGEHDHPIDDARDLQPLELDPALFPILVQDAFHFVECASHSVHRQLHFRFLLAHFEFQVSFHVAGEVLHGDDLGLVRRIFEVRVLLTQFRCLTVPIDAGRVEAVVAEQERLLLQSGSSSSSLQSSSPR
ncbi:hypothetical protein PFISCL1PPCAC_889, partial [Pristionchus fissidentatus]